MDENVVFKTAAVGGFEKRAVLDYIYQMNEQTELGKQELQNRIAELEEELRLGEEKVQGASNNLRTAQRDLSTVSSELAEEKRTRLELVACQRALENEVQQQKEVTKKKELEVDAFINKNKEALEQNQSIVAQQEKLDKSFYQMGRIMLDARTDADSIVSGAKEQAQALLSKANTNITELKAALDQETTDLLAAAREKAQKEIALAKEQSELKRKDTETVVENTLRKTKQQSDLAIAHIRERATIIIKSSAAAADASTVHLRELRRETLAIRQVITEAFGLLQKKADELDGIIGKAQDTLSNEQVALTAKNLTNLPEIDIKEIEKQYIAEKVELPIVSTEPKTPAPVVPTSKVIPLASGIGTETKLPTPRREEVKKTDIRVSVPEPLKIVEEKPLEPLLARETDRKTEKPIAPEKEVSAHQEPIVKAPIPQLPVAHEAPPLAFNMNTDKESSVGSESLLLAKDAFPTISIEVLGAEEPKKDASEDRVEEAVLNTIEEKKELPPFEPLHAWERRVDSQPATLNKDEKSGEVNAKSYPPGLEEPNKENTPTQGNLFK